MHNKQIALRQHDQDFVFSVRMQVSMVGLSDTLTSRLRSFRGKRIHQIAMWCVSYPLEAGKPWYLAARLKKPAYAMNDAPRKWWNRLDAAVKTMGLLPARADRCTYVSYTDVKKKKVKQRCFLVKIGGSKKGQQNSSFCLIGKTPGFFEVLFLGFSLRMVCRKGRCN